MKRLLLSTLLILAIGLSYAQINTEQVMLMGRNALYYEDYVLAIKRFNAVIAAKPYLSEPYFYRGLAKFYLEDYNGAEYDTSTAIDKSPFNSRYYNLRALCRINLGSYGKAEEDYAFSLRQNPMEKGSWHNMILCQMEQHKYDEADLALDSMMRLWPAESSQYTMKAQVAMARQDSLTAESWIDRAIALDQYDGNAWATKSAFLFQRDQYAAADSALTRAINQLPRRATLYINRAMARYQLDDYRGAMSDYDHAIDLDPGNYVAHLNRGLLRSQVNDINHAIEDFNYVLKLDPDNILLIYNRALLLDKMGDYRGAIRDISTVIRQYPQFWPGYMQRAAIRRKIGDVYGAERDEFAVTKAQMAVRTGTYRATHKSVRKKSSVNIDEYDQLVQDDAKPEVQYLSEIRGKVQNRQSELKCMEDYRLGFYRFNDESSQYVPYSLLLDKLNRKYRMDQSVILCRHEQQLDTMLQKLHLERIPQDIASDNGVQATLDYYQVRDLHNSFLTIDSMIVNGSSAQVNDALLYFLRAQVRIAQINVQQSTMKPSDVRLGFINACHDLKTSSRLAPDFPYAAYNRGNILVRMMEYGDAIEAYTEAIRQEPRMPESYYNRGIAYILLNNIDQGLADLSQAGELGLYQAYSLIKKYSREKERKAKKN